MATADGKTTLNSERAENRATLKVLTEADTCRKFVVPKLQAAGWDNDPHSHRGAADDHRRAHRAGREGLRPQAVETDMLAFREIEISACFAGSAVKPPG